MNDLERRWHRTWEDLRLPRPAPGAFEELLARYQEPHRAYHTIQHLEECFALLDEVRSLPKDPAAVELALWYHDIVYWPRRSDNEQASALLAETALRAAGASGQRIEAVTALIMATTHQAAPPVGDAEILVDIDLAILGAEPGRFAEYERQIRREYDWVPGFLYRRKRTEVLDTFRGRPQIYNTPRLRTRFEAQARRNLAQVLSPQQ